MQTDLLLAIRKAPLLTSMIIDIGEEEEGLHTFSLASS
jgi:hypothetical protein